MRLGLGTNCTSAAVSRAGSTAGIAGLLGLALLVIAPDNTQTAVANGDTRSISLYHAHRKDSLVVTFRRNGRYVGSALRKLNYFLRDWRNDEQVRMDPRLFDVIWEAQRMVGVNGRITVLSSYRSPRTNAMLRRRSRGVAKNSQHMYGRAMDLRISGANMHRVREAAIKMQRGGVGWYRSRFVHLDVGSVRAWPRMSYAQLTRLFPDGKTVHVARDGRTLSGYEEARRIVASRNGSYVPTLAQVREKGFLERLLGWGDSGDEADQAQARRRVARAPLGRTGVSANEENSSVNFFRRDAARRRGRGPALAKVQERAKPAESAKPAEAAKPGTPIAEEKRGIPIPVPPRRPSENKIAALIQTATGNIEAASAPVPPARPDKLIVVAENAPEAPAPIPADSRGRLAALIGLNSAGVIGAKSGLPDVITRGTAVAAHAAAPDAMAFAPPPGAKFGRARGRTLVRKLALRRSLPSTPSIARAVGMRAATQRAPASVLVAARFDRSNFNLLTRPESLALSPAHSLMGSSIASLRSAARHSRQTLIFAGQDRYQTRFVSVNAPRALAHANFNSAK